TMSTRDAPRTTMPTVRPALQPHKVAHLNRLAGALERHGIAPEEVCIVGSAVLALYGLRDNRDLDVVVKPEALARVERGRLTDGVADRQPPFELGESIEAVKYLKKDLG